MPILVRNLVLGLDEPEESLRQRAARRLKVPPEAIRLYAPVHRALDARRTEAIHFVYHVELALHESHSAERARVQRLHSPHVEFLAPRSAAPVRLGRRPLPERPVVIGFGPAGMFAALRLAEQGYCPRVLERGRDVRRRHYDILQRYYREREFDPTSNLLFGEGGAGSYSDGKLYTRVNDPLVRTVLELFYRDGADPHILIDAKPHVGSDKLPTICRHIRERIERHGGQVRFEACVDDFEFNNGHVAALRVNGERVAVGPVILAIGHSARDTIRRLAARGVQIDGKPFQIGVRIEHPQELVDRWQYGSCANCPGLPPSDYHLVAKGAAGSGDLYSFCMCPGGEILPTNESAGEIATNGASRSRRNGPFANAGLVITVTPEQVGGDALAGLAYQERWERLAFEKTGGSYRVPVQRATDFLAGRDSDGTLETSFPLGGQWCAIRAVIPPDVSAALQRGLPLLDARLPGFAGPDAMITAPETRASTPVRITRDPVTRAALGIENLYPAGEGAGYAGGIISAAIDGLKTADRIIGTYAAPR